MQNIVSSDPLSMATDSMLYSKESYTSSQVDSAKPLIIAISGCSSSGKTLLSLLLKAVFTDANISASGFANSPKASRPLVIHEDDYFIPKPHCPLVTFKTTMADNPFILKSLSGDNPWPYHIHQDNELAAIDDMHPQPTIPEKQLPYEVTGPDTDCWEAIDVPALTEVLEALKMTGVLKKCPQQHTGLQDSQADVDRWSDLIQEMQQLVNQRMASEDAVIDTKMKDVDLDIASSINLKGTRFKLPALCFVEGFLLYTDSDATEMAHIPSKNEVTSIDGDPVIRYHIDNAPKVYRLLTCESTDPASLQIPPARTSTRAERDALMYNFDIKLFLPTSKDKAKARRFSRNPYIDYPLGGRLGGQHWKTEGYFDGVAWRNYEKLHAWLLSNDTDRPGDEELRGEHSKNGDVHVRGIDAGVEDTLRWAVNVILGEICKNA